MQIKKNANVAVVVRKSWARLEGIKLFLRPPDEVQGTDDSHVIFARVLDSNDDRGFWIELNTKRHQQDPSVERFALMIPWQELLAIVLAKDFSPALEKEAQAMGFTM
ncbi:MAG: hypothetical protein LAO22_03645 [Acidobacteriia bacterium]|nr:hypothetical protein [Terriglobia bacterium]